MTSAHRAPGTVYHVTARGNARADIFLDDGDRCVKTLQPVNDFLSGAMGS